MSPEGVCDKSLASRETLLGGGSGDRVFKREGLSVNGAVPLTGIATAISVSLSLPGHRVNGFAWPHSPASVHRLTTAPETLRVIGYGPAQAYKTEKANLSSFYVDQLRCLLESGKSDLYSDETAQRQLLREHPHH